MSMCVQYTDDTEETQTYVKVADHLYSQIAEYGSQIHIYYEVVLLI